MDNQKNRYSFDYLFSTGGLGRQTFTIEDIMRMARYEDETQGNETIAYYLNKNYEPQS